jgi:hypothetical protein
MTFIKFEHHVQLSNILQSFNVYIRSEDISNLTAPLQPNNKSTHSTEIIPGHECCNIYSIHIIDENENFLILNALCLSPFVHELCEM